jgi:pimeloyl-ACP methyl ester carboxylesterase
MTPSVAFRLFATTIPSIGNECSPRKITAKRQSKWMLLLSLTILFVSIVNSQALSKNPVVVIPGIEGSKLCNSAGDVLWGDRSSYTAARISALRLPPDVATRDKGIHSCGLIETVNYIPFLWDSNIYTGLLNTLKQIGYEDKDVIKFDYDWRLSNFDNAKLLRAKIEQISSSSRSGKVDILAHSMGGLIARIYLQTLGGFERVHNLILMGTPNFGSASVFKELRDGFEHWPTAWSGGLGEIQLTILSFPSIYQLLPTYADCCAFGPKGGAVNYVDILDPEVWQRFSWLPADLKVGRRARAMGAYLQEARLLKQLMRSPISVDPEASARIHFIGNGFLDTWSRVFFDEQTGAISETILRPGDGTVLLFSATNGNPSQVQVSRKEHALIFMGDEPELVIKAVLSDQIWTSGSVEFSRTLIDQHGRNFRVDSAAIDISPKLASGNDTVNLRVDLRGASLGEADLSNAFADVLKEERVIDHLALRDLDKNTNTRSIGASIVAPNETGAYQVRITLPGVGDLSVIFATVAP